MAVLTSLVPPFLSKSVANLVKSDCRLAKDISGPTIFYPPGETVLTQNTSAPLVVKPIFFAIFPFHVVIAKSLRGLVFTPRI